MTNKITLEQLQAFFTDPNLDEAIEATRRVNDIFELIKPVENQHSRILQWLLDPHEGHGQGEAIFKDFLAAVHLANSNSKKTQPIFAEWTPAKIAITGFQSLIVIREKAMLGKGRQDLMLVDPVHKFVIVVENKAGSSWTKFQLDKYQIGLKALTRRGGPYQGFSSGFVLLDKGKDELTELPANVKGWAYVDYGWLERAARRAMVQISRGMDGGQQLVISYCRRQAGYGPDVEDELEALAAKVAQAHRTVTTVIADVRRRKRPTKMELAMTTEASQLWIWAHQHRDLAEVLAQQKALSFIKDGLKKEFPAEDIRFDMRKRCVFICTERWARLTQDTERWWAIRIRIWERSLENQSEEVHNDAPEPKYRLDLEWYHPTAKPEFKGSIRAALLNVYAKELGIYSDANIRRLGTKQNITQDKLLRLLIELFRTTNELLLPII